MVVVFVYVVGDSFSADVADMVVVIIHMIGDSLAADVTDMVVVAVNVVGDGFAADITNVVVVIVCMVGNGFPTDVTKVVMILIRVVGNGFTADVTLMVGILVFVRARVCTDGANAVFEGMRRFLHRDLAAAVPFLGMRCFGLFPDFLTGVVFGVQFAVCFAADFADSFVFASSRSAGMAVVHRNGDLCHIARLVGGDNRLPAARGCKGKGIIRAELDSRAVYRNAFEVLFLHRHSLRAAIGFAVFNAAKSRSRFIQHKLFGVDYNNSACIVVIVNKEYIFLILRQQIADAHRRRILGGVVVDPVQCIRGRVEKLIARTDEHMGDLLRVFRIDGYKLVAAEVVNADIIASPAVAGEHMAADAYRAGHSVRIIIPYRDKRDAFLTVCGKILIHRTAVGAFAAEVHTLQLCIPVLQRARVYDIPQKVSPLHIFVGCDFRPVTVHKVYGVMIVFAPHRVKRYGFIGGINRFEAVCHFRTVRKRPADLCVAEPGKACAAEYDITALRF